MTIRPVAQAFALLSLLCAGRAQAVELTTITPKGHVTFSAGDNWAVIASQTNLPVAVWAFQIPDPADEGTPHSTNVSVSFYDLNAPQGKEAFKVVGKAYGKAAPSTSRVGEWQVLEQANKQNGTSYILLDAYKVTADVTVAVRLAWPQLPGHAKDYDRRMRGAFQALLGSVHGEIGPYQRKPGDVVRRPAR